MSLREAAQQALEALLTYEQYIQPLTNYFGGPRVPEEGSASAKVDAAINALRAALAEPVQEPVAWMDIDENGNRLTVRQWSDGNREEVPLYIAPPQRKPLTEEQVDRAYQEIWRDSPEDFGRTASEWIEAGIRYAERAHGIGEQK